MLDKDYMLKRRFRKTVEEIERIGQGLIRELEKQTFPSAMLRDVVLQTMKTDSIILRRILQKVFQNCLNIVMN